MELNRSPTAFGADLQCRMPRDFPGSGVARLTQGIPRYIQSVRPDFSPVALAASYGGEYAWWVAPADPLDAHFSYTYLSPPISAFCLLL